MEINSHIKVRLFQYKSFRHYGGREIKEIPHIVSARLIALQDDHQKYIVELTEPCFAYKKGHTIAICEKDFNV